MIREYSTVVTRKGQVTVPQAIRRALGLKVGDKVAFVLEGGQARLTSKTSVIAATAGAVHWDGPPLTAEELREATERSIAEEVAERTRS